MDKPNDDNRPDAIDPGATEANVANATQSAASASDERKRIAGILSSKEADGRKDLAEHLAYNTDLSVEAATAMLSKAPVAKADILSDAMAGEPNSVIGDEGEPPREPSKAENLAANFAAMTGRKPKG
jgi:hypothetical protein